ncbi:hypothetical protein M413DRAFT_228732 [Hebeloma cylindrosporum]|uniref:PARG catalytic Macro domain-containing protein n=1 Tax=Hebeloma cylindrosporum TaxID=76867 RepID=A0A0C3CW19_HEBCY|nr:hypothetical protein M413DRAFT_228732 [Hebeloma cylindrosporum h7]
MDHSASERYILPSHPSLISLDPLGISDEENPSHWTVISLYIAQFRASSNYNLLHLPDLIEDLSYSIHMNGNLDTRFLRRYILQKHLDSQSQASQALLDHILDAALHLPHAFPSHGLSYLQDSNPLLQLTTSKIKCLLAHQILNTLQPSKGNTWGCTFPCWYSEPQPFENAVSGYLSSVFTFFLPSQEESSPVTYQYSSNRQENNIDEFVSWKSCTTIPLFEYLAIDPVSAATVPFPHPSISCTLVASNKCPGFGAACTQEELVTAACPPLLPMGALFVAPPIPPDAALLVSGNVFLTEWKGQGRESIHLGTSILSKQTFLFIDASELDECASSTLIPDLNPAVLSRDLHKAHTGFLALARLHIKDIASPLWGAGSFGGDPIVKALVLLMAAARVGVKLHLSVDDQRTYDMTGSIPGSRKVIEILRDFKESCQNLSIGDIMERLATIDGCDVDIPSHVKATDGEYSKTEA